MGRMKDIQATAYRLVQIPFDLGAFVGATTQYLCAVGPHLANEEPEEFEERVKRTGVDILSGYSNFTHLDRCTTMKDMDKQLDTFKKKFGIG